jgi:hypothetical protein
VRLVSLSDTKENGTCSAFPGALQNWRQRGLRADFQAHDTTDAGTVFAVSPSAMSRYFNPSPPSSSFNEVGGIAKPRALKMHGTRSSVQQ